MAKRTKQPLPAAATTAEQIDRDLAKRALDKRRAGQTPTAREAAALRRIEKAREEELRWQYYSSIPQKHWRAMSGRQAKVINEQAQRYGIPFGGATINLAAVVKALHDFLAENKAVLTIDGDDDEQSEELDKWRAVKRQREEIKLNAELGLFIPRDQIRTGFVRVATILRRAGETLQKQFGAEAHAIVEEALSDAERVIMEDLDRGDGDAA